MQASRQVALVRHTQLEMLPFAAACYNLHSKFTDTSYNIKCTSEMACRICQITMKIFGGNWTWKWKQNGLG